MLNIAEVKSNLAAKNSQIAIKVLGFIFIFYALNLAYMGWAPFYAFCVFYLLNPTTGAFGVILGSFLRPFWISLAITGATALVVFDKFVGHIVL